MTTRAALDQALTAPVGGRQLIEVPLCRADRRAGLRAMMGMHDRRTAREHWTGEVADLLRVRDGLRAVRRRPRRRRPATPMTRMPRRRISPPAPASWTSCRSACSRRAGPTHRMPPSCSCCRRWTPRAKAASSATSSGRSTRRASCSPPSRSRRPRSSRTTSSGGSSSACRRPGYIGVFDRSHYEDVLIGKVRSLAPADEIERRYGAINEFEKRLTDAGTRIVKVMLHISYEEQGERLMERLDRPDKHWKYNPGDVDERALLAALHGRVPDRVRAHLHRERPVVRRAGEPQVVRAARRAAPAARVRCEESTRSGRPRRSTSRRRRSGSRRPRLRRSPSSVHRLDR